MGKNGQFLYNEIKLLIIYLLFIYILFLLHACPMIAIGNSVNITNNKSHPEYHRH